MSTPYFRYPPTILSPSDQQQWFLRLREAEQIVGITEAGTPLVSGETLALLQRYVAGELTLEQVVRLQCQRLKG